MKNNRKNRKLTFIRKKNSVRLGFNKVCFQEKTSNSIVIDEDYKDNLMKEAKEYLYKLFKLALPICDIQTGTTNDDFIMDTTTIRVTMSLR